MESMRYGRYTFRPAGKLKKVKTIADVILKNRNELKIWDEGSDSFYHDRASKYYTHEAFYRAMNNSEDDLFICEQNGKTYIPCEHELMEFMGYRS